MARWVNALPRLLVVEITRALQEALSSQFAEDPQGDSRITGAESLVDAQSCWSGTVSCCARPLVASSVS